MSATITLVNHAQRRAKELEAEIERLRSQAQEALEKATEMELELSRVQSQLLRHQLRLRAEEEKKR